MPNETPSVALSQDQLDSFGENGFLVLEGLLDDDDLKPLEDEYAELLDGLCDDLAGRGLLPERFANLPFGERYSRAVAHYPDLHSRLNISLPLINGDVDADRFHMHGGPAVFGLLRNRKILDVVESVIGPEIQSSPVQQMRMKPPDHLVADALKGHSNVGATTWHQDIVALLPEADRTRQVTVWVAITDATKQSGCLVSVPGSHRQGPRVHCANEALASEPQVPAKVMAGSRAVPLPVRRGGAILFHKLNVHRALPNRSRGLRWSADLRYHPVGEPSGRPAFPGFIARSRSDPSRELHDPQEWAERWRAARRAILEGVYTGRLFEDSRWNDATVC